MSRPVAFVAACQQPFALTSVSAASVGRVWRWLLLLGLSASLAACGSRIRLDEPPLASTSMSTPVAVASVSTVEQPVTPAATGESMAQRQVGEPSALSPSTTDPLRAVPTLETSAAPAVKPADVPYVVYFDFDSTLVREEFRPVLEAHAQYLSTDSRRQVVLEGHADERGSREYNLALGQRRSESVRRSLVLLGVSDPQMESVSFGEEKPAVLGQDEAAYAQNRRVELSYR